MVVVQPRPQPAALLGHHVHQVAVLAGAVGPGGLRPIDPGVARPIVDSDIGWPSFVGEFAPTAGGGCECYLTILGEESGVTSPETFAGWCLSRAGKIDVPGEANQVSL